MSNAAQSRGVGELGRSNFLKARRLGIDTHHEAVVFMRQDCHVCRSEGFEAHNCNAVQGRRTTPRTWRSRVVGVCMEKARDGGQ